MGLQSAMNQRSDRERAQRGLRTAGLGIGINAALVVLKAAIGLLGHSQALLADAVHSGGDLGNSCIAFVSFLFSRRPPQTGIIPMGMNASRHLVRPSPPVSSSLLERRLAMRRSSRWYAATLPIPRCSTLVAAGIALVIKLGLGFTPGRLPRARAINRWERRRATMRRMWSSRSL